LLAICTRAFTPLGLALHDHAEVDAKLAQPVRCLSGELATVHEDQHGCAKLGGEVREDRRLARAGRAHTEH
jgi:hypothetical protein